MNESHDQGGQNNIEYISINEEGIVLWIYWKGSSFFKFPLSIMHKNIELCENIDKLGMFLRSSDENTEKKNKPFSDLSEILGKDSN
ncbi:MAG: hypothetical protein Ct9H90mP13_07790 [Pseudomonadota bacterium]|nr:MAG: hypothetical protein Ct9H90mP13_07790 [Pseudomonadota bacterium]